jgi:hypothetical protein
VFAGRMTDVRLVVIAGGLTVMLAAAGALVGPPPAQIGGDGSSFSAGARGGKAAFETLGLLGYEITRSVEPLTAIDADARRTLLVLTGSMPGSDQDKRAIQEFLKAGGAVLTVGDQGADLLGFGGSTTTTNPLATPATHRVLAVSPLSAGVEEITMVAPSRGLALPPSYLAPFARSATEPLVATARIGDGRATWLAEITPLANEHIRSAGNFQLLLNIAGAPGGRRILWDEHYHGYSRSLWSYVAGTPLPWVAAQCGLLALAAFATFSRRRLPIRSRIRDVRTSPMEFIEMLRVLYARAGGASSAVTAARVRFRKRMTLLAGLSVDAPDPVVARAAASRCAATEDEVLNLLGASRRIAEGSPTTTAEALTLTARLQQLSAELDGVHPASRPRSPDASAGHASRIPHPASRGPHPAPRIEGA